VNGTFAGNVQVNSNTKLGGSGTVGSVTINGGTLAPGNSIGTLNVAGNVDFSAGGVYEVEVDAAGNSDRIVATGTATLTNGSVQVLPAAGNYNLTTDYTILTAAGGLGGTKFGSVDSTLAFLTPTLLYDANNVFLRLTRNNVSFSAVAGTPNQVAVGTTINTLSNTNPGGIQELLNNLFILTADGANQAYDSLSGVQHTHGNLVALQSVNQFRNILFDRFNGSNQFLAHDGRIMLAHNHTDTMTDAGSRLLDGDAQPHRGWWMHGTGNFGDIDDTRNASGADYKAGGIAAGVDFDLGDNLTAGAAIGYTRTDADVASGGIDVDSYQAALYGRLTLDNGYYVSGLTGVGYHDMDASRNVSAGLLNTSAKADYHAWTTTLAVEGGRSFSLNRATSLTPFLGLEYTHVNRESFTEKGSTATNLKVSEDNQDSLRSAIGARIAHDWTTGNGYRITPTAELAWIHEFMEDEAGIRAGFASAPAVTFSVDGPELDRDRARVALGFNLQFRETAYLNLGYRGEFASSDERHDLAATLRVMW
jgi:outer membrane autotransporter protein